MKKILNLETKVFSPTRLSSAGKRKFPLNLPCENYAKKTPDWARWNSKSDLLRDRKVQSPGPRIPGSQDPRIPAFQICIGARSRRRWPKMKKILNLETNALSPTRLSFAGKRKLLMNLLCENYAKSTPDWARQNSQSDLSHDRKIPNPRPRIPRSQDPWTSRLHWRSLATSVS